MKDHFSALGFAPTLLLDSGEVEQSWRNATRSNSERGPEKNDSNSADSKLALVHEARAVLTDPVKRLAHWLLLQGITPSRATSMGSEMMNLFGSLGKVLANTDEFLGRYQKATSALTKALLTRESITVQLELQNQMQQLQKHKQSALDRFPDLEALASENRFDEATSILQELQFLTKWEAQCQERLLSLLACG